MARHDLMLCTRALFTNRLILDYSYKHESLGQFSLIDYFMTGVDILNDIKDFDIVDNALNLSDHNPIIVSLTFDTLSLPINIAPPVHPLRRAQRRSPRAHRHVAGSQPAPGASRRAAPPRRVGRRRRRRQCGSWSRARPRGVRVGQTPRRARADYAAYARRISSTVFGIAAVRLSGPAAVTTMSSSIRTPIPRHSAGTLS